MNEKRFSEKKSLASPRYDILSPREVKFERSVKKNTAVYDYNTDMILPTRYRVSESVRRNQRVLTSAANSNQDTSFEKSPVNQLSSKNELAFSVSASSIGPLGKRGFKAARMRNE